LGLGQEKFRLRRRMSHRRKVQIYVGRATHEPVRMMTMRRRRASPYRERSISLSCESRC
jgi:hypothetical protein